MGDQGCSSALSGAQFSGGAGVGGDMGSTGVPTQSGYGMTGGSTMAGSSGSQ
jgi:hypothetical protein